MPIRGERIGLTENVVDVIEAIRWLDRWGGTKNSTVRPAIAICSKALEAQASVSDARNAFAKAAKATGNMMGMK